MNQNKIRTARRFVEDLLTDGRSFKHILIVAKNTYWKTSLDDVERVLSVFSEKLSK